METMDFAISRLVWNEWQLHPLRGFSRPNGHWPTYVLHKGLKYYMYVCRMCYYFRAPDIFY